MAGVGETAAWRAYASAELWLARLEGVRAAAGHARARGARLFRRFRGMTRGQWAALARAQARRLFSPLEVDRGAALLAAPLALGLGSAVYLGLEREPSAWPAPAAALLAAGLFGLALRRAWSPWIARAAALAGLFALGFALADLRVESRDAPRVAEQSAPYEVEGWVESIDASSPARRRYTIRVTRLDGATEGLPRRVRIGAAAGAAGLGDVVRVRAVLDPPRGPPTPGAYDFSRSAHFEQLGGVGYAVGGMVRAPDAALEGAPARGRRLAALRGALSQRLQAAGGEGAGGVLAALVTGDRSEIDPGTTDALYVSGLGHILSISGMHLALIGGGAFFVLAWTLAAIEPLARRMNVRKLAAAGALAFSLAYLMISGAEAPAVRSFVMAGIAFGAILFDRRALTQRGVAIAGLVILAVAPENATAPGFQMSFASVVALVAANDLLRAHNRAMGLSQTPREPGVVGAARRFLFGLVLTSLVAGLATAPFAAYHFNRVAVLGYLANVVAMPVFSAVVMPCAAIAGLLAPFGLEDVPAWIGARAIDVVVAIGEMAAAQPGAQSGTPAARPIALALAAMALVAGAVLARGRWRLALPLALAATLLWRAPPAGDLWLGEDGGWLAHVPGTDGGEWVGEIESGEGYGAELYLRRAGFEGAPVLAPAESQAFACDPAGCAGRIDRKVVVVAERWSTVVADCARADLVLTPGWPSPRVRARCEGATLVPRRGRGDRGGVVDLGAPEPQLVAAGGEGRPWRAGG
jgi:competence protein ComEC